MEFEEMMNYMRREGMEEGREKGWEEGIGFFAVLSEKLLEDSRLEDLTKAAKDKEFRDALFAEYGIPKKVLRHPKN